MDLRRTDKWDKFFSYSSVRHHGCSMAADAGSVGGRRSAVGGEVPFVRTDFQFPVRFPFVRTDFHYPDSKEESAGPGGVGKELQEIAGMATHINRWGNGLLNAANIYRYVIATHLFY